MTCADCVRRIEEGLNRTPGVYAATVNFASEKAHIEFEPAEVDVEALQNKVRDLGYEAFVEDAGFAAGPGKVTVSVGGMTCAACVRRVENALKEVAGVTEANVNLATSRATVTHSANWGGLTALEEAITEHGYQYLGEIKASGVDPADAARVRDLRELKLKVTCGAILSVVIFFGSMQHWFSFLQIVPHQIMLYAMFVLTAPAVFWVGSRFFIGAIKAARQKTSDMNTLVAVGALSAYLYSAAATFFPHFFMTAGVMPQSQRQDFSGDQTAHGPEAENGSFIAGGERG